MKRTSPNLILWYLLLFLPLLSLKATPSIFPMPRPEVKAPGTYFIFAPSGLNLRATSSPSSKKLQTIPYGAKVALLTSAASKDMMVDNFPGGMAKVKYGNTEGFIFDGYLSQFPAPEIQQEVAKYVEKIRNNGHSALYENCTRDYDGYFQEEESIALYKTDWAEAFLVAKQLFKIPSSLLFPKPSKKEEETFANPDKEELVWEDTITVKRDKKGELISIIYYYRREGSGRSISIKADPEYQAIRLSLTLIAD